MRTLAALLILAAWLAITAVTGAPVAGTSTIAAVVTDQLQRQLAFAAGFLAILALWLLLCSLLFGAPHVLNVFLIGHLGAAIGQAVFASLGGIMFLSLRIRTGSLWPVILLHAAWNTGLILIGREAPPLDPNQAIPLAAVAATALAMLPVLAYPFWLLRHVGRDGDGIGRPPPPPALPARTPWGDSRT